MSLNYLITMALIAVCTALALRPITRTRGLGIASFALGQLVNELPQLAAVLLLGSTAIVAVEGELDLSSTGGLLIAAVVAMILVGLVEVARRALGAAPVLRHVLDVELGLGPDGRARAGVRPRVHPVRGLVGFLPVRPRSVIRLADVPYGPHRRQRLDVYHRRDRRPGAPVLVYWHGGGYFSGGKHREARALLHRLAQRGWVCVDANYRLRPEADLVDHLDDARAAVEWARAHAGEWGGDPEVVALAGSSAGAHLATLLGLGHSEAACARVAADDARASRVAVLDAGPIAAVIGLYGYYGSYYGQSDDGAVPSTPLLLDGRGAPALMIIDAGLDSYVGTDGGAALARHVAAASPRPVVRAVLPGAQHAFDVYRSFRFEAVVDACVAFLEATTASGVERATEPVQGSRHG